MLMQVCFVELLIILIVFTYVLNGSVMCINPRYVPIRTRFERRYMRYHHAWCDCNNCPDCFRKRRQHYMIRNHFETLSTFQKGGFVLLDTLTYRDKYIDHTFVWSDHSPFVLKNLLYEGEKRYHYVAEREFVRGDTGEIVTRKVNFYSSRSMPKYKPEYLYRVNLFNYEHIKLFWKRLRTNIERMYNVSVKDSIRYFAVPEFGHDNGRPHWHLAVFCTVPGLTNYQLKQHINLAWRSIPVGSVFYELPWSTFTKKQSEYYNFLDYSDSEIELYDFGATDWYSQVDYNTITDIRASKHIRYVTKYVLKDSVVDSQLCALFNVHFPSKLPTELHQKIRCSIGFGDMARCSDDSSLPSNLRLSTYYDSDREKILLPYDSSDGQQHRKVGFDEYPLTNYYIRRMYYRTQKLPDKTYVSLPNDLFVNWRLSQLHRMHNEVKNSISLHFSMIEKQCPDDFERLQDIMSDFTLDELSIFICHLYNRDISDSCFRYTDGVFDWSHFVRTCSVDNDIMSISSSPSERGILNRNRFFDYYKPFSEVVSILKSHNKLLSDYYRSQYAQKLDYQSQYRYIVAQHKK